jgi:serine/threonine-protein kinase RsbW
MDCIVNSRVSAPSMILIPADLVSIAVVRAAICEALKEHGWNDDACRRVVLAASEAVANAVEHGSQDGELVEIVYAVGDDEAQVRVLDSGGHLRWTPPAEPAPPPATATRGRGLAIIRALAQKVEFRPAGQGIELRLDFSRAA